MLSDSKVREAGFIRNSSSRKIVYHPEPENQKLDSDDSFSSFQYENPSKISVRSVQKPFNSNSQSREKQYDSGIKQVSKPLTPQIPKPAKKLPQQPQFQNERLKNNFFQEPCNTRQQDIQRLKQVLPLTNTPQFNESNFKQDLEEVNNICNRIGSMKLQGNFSFNPKTNNNFMKQQKIQEKLQHQSDEEEDEQSFNNKKQVFPNHVNKNNTEIQGTKKPKQNNYFSNNTVGQKTANNKFQYDFESSSSQDEEGEEEVQNSEFERNDKFQQDDEDNQALRYYEQHRKKTEPQNMTRTQPKVNLSNAGKISTRPNNLHQNQSYNHSHQNVHESYSIHNKKPTSYPVSRKVQNQQSSHSSSQNDQKLITQYKKDDFGTKIPVEMRKRKQQLTENRGYQNMPEAQMQEGMIATHGGVCFDVDVKQFSQNSSVAHTQPIRRVNQQPKKKKVNQKEEILRRRQMAKIYSKQARFRLFGFA